MVLNTSFNEHEPIVCTPADALSCFLKTRMDVLVLGDRVLSRRAPDARHSCADRIGASFEAPRSGLANAAAGQVRLRFRGRRRRVNERLRRNDGRQPRRVGRRRHRTARLERKTR